MSSNVVAIYAAAGTEAAFPTKLGTFRFDQQAPCFLVTEYNFLGGHRLVAVLPDIEQAVMVAELAGARLGLEVLDGTLQSALPSPSP